MLFYIFQCSINSFNKAEIHRIFNPNKTETANQIKPRLENEPIYLLDSSPVFPLGKGNKILYQP